MKRAYKPFTLLIALLLLIAVLFSCGEKETKKAPVFEELKSERIAAYYGDGGLIVPGSQYICRAYEKTDFELIREAIATEEYRLKLDAFFDRIEFKDLTLDHARLDEIRAGNEGKTEYEDPVYICDLKVTDKEIALLDTVLAEAFGLQLETAEPAPAG